MNLKDLVVRIKGDITDLKAKVGMAKNEVSGLGKQLGSAGAAMTKTGAMMTAAVTPVAVGFGYATKRAIDFEDSMANVRKTTGMSGAELKDLEKGIRDLATKIPLAHEELAGIAAVAGQLGIQGKENILSFTRTAAMMATAFDMSAEDAATAMAKLANIYDIPVQEVDRLGSAINTLGNTTAASEAEIIRAMYQVGASGKMLGATQQQIAAMTATLISMGMAPERAGTRMMSAFNQLGANIDKLAEITGEDIGTLRKKFETDFYGTLTESLKKMQEIYTNNERFSELMNNSLEKLATGFQLPKEQVRELYTEFLSLKEQGVAPELIKQKLSEMSSELGISGSNINKLTSEFENLSSRAPGSLGLMTAMSRVFGQVGAKAMLSIAMNTETLETNLKNANLAYQQNTSLSEEFGNKTDTLKAKLQTLKNMFADIAIEVGQVLGEEIKKLLPHIKELIPDIREFAVVFTKSVIPAFKEVGKVIMPLLKAFNSLSPGIKELIAKFSALAVVALAVVGPILMVIGSVLQGVGAIMGFVGAMGGASSIISSIIPILSALLGPIGLVVIAIGLLAVAWTQNWFGIRDIVSNAVSAIIEFLGNLSKGFSDKINFIGNAVRGFYYSWSNTWNSIREKAIQAVLGMAAWVSSAIGNFVSGIASRVINIINTVENIKASIRNKIMSLISDAYNWGANLIGNLISGISSGISNLINTVRNIASTIGSYLGIHSDAERGALSDLTNWGGNLVKTYISGIESEKGEINKTLNNLIEPPTFGVAVRHPEENLGVNLREMVGGIKEELVDAVKSFRNIGIAEEYGGKFPATGTQIYSPITINIDKVENKSDVDYMITEVERRLANKTMKRMII